MAREVIHTKFNKNHITIQEIENPEICPYPQDVMVYETYTTSGPKYYWDPCKKIETVVRKESPLGFYYNKIETQIIKQSDRNKNDVRQWIVLNYYHNNILYRLKFLTKWDDISVGETESSIRPWEVAPGDKSLNDNMISSLECDVKNFFANAESFKINTIYIRNGGYGSKMEKSRYSSLTTLKNEIYKYLFGNINGIRFQTDMEKLLAHGFDPKYSFRKDKEKK